MYTYLVYIPNAATMQDMFHTCQPPTMDIPVIQISTENSPKCIVIVHHANARVREDRQVVDDRGPGLADPRVYGVRLST